MSIKKIALTAVAAAAFLAPTMTGASAHHIDGKRHLNNYDKHVVAKRFHTATPRIDRRIANQARRIRVGRRSGDLTFREMRRLRKGLRNIRRARNFAKRDGRVTRWERQDLLSMLNRNGKKIRRLRNNRKNAHPTYRKLRKFINYNY